MIIKQVSSGQFLFFYTIFRIIVMNDCSKDNKTSDIGSPRFSSVANAPNPDRSIQISSILTSNNPSNSTQGNDIESPSIQQSSSLVEVQTKSIINTSKTSGAVVSNTPEAGLKRVPTVTFFESKTINTKPGLFQEHSTLSSDSQSINDNNSPKKNIKPTSPLTSIPLRSPSSPQGGLSILKTKTEETLRSTDEMLEIIPKSIIRGAKESTSSPVASIPACTNDAIANQYPLSPQGDLNSLSQNENKILSKQLESMSIEATQTIWPNIPKREKSKNIDPRLPQDDGKLHILFGATGAIGVFKIKLMIKKLEEIYGRDRITVQVILTQSAARFFTKKYSKKLKLSVTSNRNVSDAASGPKASYPQPNNSQNQVTITEKNRISSNNDLPPLDTSFCYQSSTNSPPMSAQAELPPYIQVWTDQDEWDAWAQRTDPVLHIELRRWADILVVAPLTANTLTKISLGLCDNLLTCVIRAWNPSYPILLAPSMISSTFNCFLTKKQLGDIKEEMPWITVFKPSEKIMDVNGDIGLGGMMDWNEIVDRIIIKLGGYPKEDDTGQEEEEEEEEDDDDEDDDGEDTHGDKKADDIDSESDDDEDDDEDDDDDDDEEGDVMINNDVLKQPQKRMNEDTSIKP